MELWHKLLQCHQVSCVWSQCFTFLASIPGVMDMLWICETMLNVPLISCHLLSQKEWILIRWHSQRCLESCLFEKYDFTSYYAYVTFYWDYMLSLGWKAFCWPNSVASRGWCLKMVYFVPKRWHRLDWKLMCTAIDINAWVKPQRHCESPRELNPTLVSL